MRIFHKRKYQNDLIYRGKLFQSGKTDRVNLQSKCFELANWFEVSIDDLVRGDMSKSKMSVYADNNLWATHSSFPSVSEAEADDEEGDVVCPRIGLEGLNSYLSFKAAYEKDLQLQKTGDKSLLSDIMKLYTEAFDQGIIEAAVNMLRY